MLVMVIEHMDHVMLKLFGLVLWRHYFEGADTHSG
jgi:hypothetical protein